MLSTSRTDLVIDLEPDSYGWTSTQLVDGGPLAAPAVPVLELIAARAAAAPGRPALVHGSVQLSYAQLLRAVERRAAELAADGAGPGRLVATSRARGLDAVVAILAIGSTGAAYLPLDEGAPAARNAAILADACGSAPADLPGCPAARPC